MLKVQRDINQIKMEANSIGNWEWLDNYKKSLLNKNKLVKSKLSTIEGETTKGARPSILINNVNQVNTIQFTIQQLGSSSPKRIDSVRPSMLRIKNVANNKDLNEQFNLFKYANISSN